MTYLPSILVIDPDPQVIQSLDTPTIGRYYKAHGVLDPLSILESLRTVHPSALMISLGLTAIPSLTLVRMLRLDSAYREIPIIMLIDPSDSTALRVQAMDAGETHFLHKPLQASAVVTKLNQLYPQLHFINHLQASLKAGTIEVNTLHHESKVNNQSVNLTPIEFKLLRLLIERKGRVQTREHLLNSVWEYASEIETRTIDTHIKRLREKLGDQGTLIQTIRGVGYKLIDASAN